MVDGFLFVTDAVQKDLNYRLREFNNKTLHTAVWLLSAHLHA